MPDRIGVVGLFGKHKDAPRDYSQMSAEEALKLAREKARILGSSA